MHPKTYVVSLLGSPRRVQMRDELERIGLPFEFSDGVVMPLERVEYLRCWLRIRFPELNLDDAAETSRLSHGSLGTLLAYLAVFQRIATDEANEVSLVLEDDCIAHRGMQFSSIDWEKLHASVGRPMVLFLHKCSHPFGLVAQMVSRQGARAIIDRVEDVLRSNMPIDLYIWQHPEITHTSLYRTTGAWLFKHATPTNQVCSSERLRINRTYGCEGDYVNKR